MQATKTCCLCCGATAVVSTVVQLPRLANRSSRNRGSLSCVNAQNAVVFLDTYIYTTFILGHYQEFQNHIFLLEHISRDKIHKNSPLNTQSHSFVHQSSSSIIYDHIGCIHAWFCNITSCLVRFSLTLSNFNVFPSKPSLLLLVCS